MNPIRFRFANYLVYREWSIASPSRETELRNPCHSGWTLFAFQFKMNIENIENSQLYIQFKDYVTTFGDTSRGLSEFSKTTEGLYCDVAAKCFSHVTGIYKLVKFLLHSFNNEEKLV